MPQEIVNIPVVKNIMIYGVVTSGASLVDIEIIHSNPNYRVSCFVDDDSSKHGKLFGLPVLSWKEFTENKVKLEIHHFFVSIGNGVARSKKMSICKKKGLLPINKQSNLRPLATINQINKSIVILKSKPKIKRSMWSRRAQEYEQKITSGKIYDLAEVVRDLNKGDDLMVDQSYSERQLFEKAYERILTEFQVVMALSLEDTKKKLDKALKRNLETQTPKVEPKPEEPTITSE